MVDIFSLTSLGASTGHTNKRPVPWNNPLDTSYKTSQYYGSNLVRSTKWSIAQTVEPVDYLNTLGTTSDPLTYIQLLHLHWSANVPQVPKRYAERIIEILSYTYMQTTFTVLDLAKIEDYPTLDKVYSALINNIIPEALHRAQGSVQVTVTDPYLGARRIKSEMTAETRDIVIAQINKAREILDLNMSKIAGRLSQLRDSSATPTRLDWHGDPLSNPFLVYDAQKSVSEAVFTDIAVNKTTTSGTATSVTNDFIDKKHLDNAAALQEEYKRELLQYNPSIAQLSWASQGVDTITPDSERDAPPSKASALPWVLGALATAAAYFTLAG